VIMTKKTVADASAELYKLLESFQPEERVRIVRGTLTLLGDPLSGDILATQEDESHAKGVVAGASGGKQMNARTYFDQKKPHNKIEELATAARYREQTGVGNSSKKEDFQKVIADARRNFDAHNFMRDIGNARNAGFFNKGGSIKTGYALSYYGQNYVDTLPDKKAARSLPRPKRVGVKKKKK